MANYQQQLSSQTLAQGIQEYVSLNQAQLKTRNLTPRGEAFFRCHDVVHVVFGCGISLPEEAVVKISSLFGTTAGFSVLKGYALPESKEVYETLGFRDIVNTTAKSIILVPRTFYRCLRMHKRWPWEDHEEYMAQSLADIRRVFGIRVALSG